MENNPLNEKSENEAEFLENEQNLQSEEALDIEEANEQTAQKSQKGYILYKVFTITAVLLTVMFCSALVGIKIYLAVRDIYSSKLDQIDKIVRENYVGEIDDEVLEDALANAYMEAIGDKYSFYKNAEGGEKVEDSLAGNTTGIGVTVYNDDKNKALSVFRVDTNSPAHTAGIKVGDKIIAIDGKKVADEGYENTLKSIQREIGKTAEIKLLRDGKEITLKVVYKEFVRQSVYYEVVKGYGYITITAFNEATVKQFEQAFEDLVSQNVKGLIFDLRSNGGGTVKSTCQILDILLGECNLISYRYADGSVEVDKKSDAKKCDLPMAVLVNGKTASASELFAANLRDVAKAPIIGNNTYGKGVVQRTYFLSDDSCIRFTIAEFLPAGGVCFDGEGLAPDVEVVLTEWEAENYYDLGENEPYLKKAIEQLEK